MIKKVLGCVVIVAVFIAGSYSGFIAGVESEKHDIAKRSVSMGSCKLVFR